MYEVLQLVFAVTLVSSLLALIVKARADPQRGPLVARFWKDVRLFKVNFLRLALAIVLIVYVQGVVGRTLAYYLHHRLADYTQGDSVVVVAPRLFDIGHAVTPDYSSSTAIQVLNEALQYAMFLGLAGIFAVPYWLQLLRGRGVELYTVNMVTRFLVTLACGHVLRMACYLATSLPGPAQHCIVDAGNQPTALSQIFSSPRVGGNCGDLVFSGHMFTAVTILCTIQLYAERMFGLKRSLVFVVCFMPLPICQVVNILMLRAHYSVDMVVAVEVGVCLNLVLSRLVWTQDASPCASADSEVTIEPERSGADADAVAVVIDEPPHGVSDSDVSQSAAVVIDKEEEPLHTESETDDSVGNGASSSSISLHQSLTPVPFFM